MTTEAPATDRQTIAIEQAAQEIGHSVTIIRGTIDTAKGRLDNGVDPEKVSSEMTSLINAEQNRMAKLVAGQTKAVAQALADRYGMTTYLKKHTPLQISVKLADHIVRGITKDSAEHSKIVKTAQDVRYRQHCIEEAGRTLRYWASEKFEADGTSAWRGDGVEKVQDMLKHMGMVYCQARGHDGIVVYPDSPVGDKTVEQALRYIGNYAMERLLTGPGRWYGESSMMQIRLGDLLPMMLQDLGLRVTVRLTLGALDVRGADDRINVPYDDASEYQPRYRTGGGRTAFDALKP